jgi:serine/threonine-protein kinase
MFGRYRIVRQIGRGGMGAVYEAVHADLEKRVALKVLLPSTVSQSDMLARFEREGRAAARIRHPNVVDVSDVGVEAGMPFLVMEYLEGEDLSHLLRREGALPVERVAEIMVPVLGAVAAAHAQGVVHRDLKPENIFLARVGDGTVVPKVLDFGISKMAQAEGHTALTGSGMMMGTAHYMSPEQAQSTKSVDGQSDQFTLGVILYECATGTKPFQGEVLFMILKAIVEGNYLRPRLARPDLPERFEAMLMRALRNAPGERFPSVTALADELRAFAPAMGRPSWTPAVAPSSWVPTIGPVTGPAPDTFSAASRAAAVPAKPSRKGLWIGLGLCAAVLLAVGGAAASMGNSEPTVTPAAVQARVQAPAAPIVAAPSTAPRAASPRAAAPVVAAPVVAAPVVAAPVVAAPVVAAPVAAAPANTRVVPAAPVGSTAASATTRQTRGHGEGRRRPRGSRADEGSFMPIMR